MTSFYSPMGVSRIAGTGMSEPFPDPFLDIATLNMPRNLRNALYWCEYIYMSHGTYRMALERVISYFLRDIEFGDSEVGDEEQEKWLKFMHETADVMTHLQCSLRNRMCYGNDFTSIVVPFKRFLVCPRCGVEYTLETVYNTPEFQFAWEDMQFVATCPSCKTGTGYRGKWKVVDRTDNLEDRLHIKHWNPHEIEILHDYYTDETAYLWRIPEDYKAQVRKGNLYHLERVPLPVLEAIRNNLMFRFNDGVIYHMKEPTLAGIRNRGWGIPRTLSNFRIIYYVQVLRRYNEAIALDYVIPFRLITPAPRPGAGAGGGALSQQMMDPLLSFSGADFRSQVNAMLRRRRRDPASWHVLPFPVQYQLLGGDASRLAPRDLLDQGTEQMLNDAGIPVELYRGSLQIQSAPPALRLFEATWHHLVHDANAWLQWFVRQVSQVMNWEPVNARLRRVTIADDVQAQMMQLQLMMGQQLSGTTGFKALGLDWKAEQKQIGQEALFQAEQQAKVQEMLDQAGFAAEIAKGQPAGGAPGAPAGAAPGGAAGAPPGGGGAPAGGGQSQAAPGMPMAGPVSQYLASMGANTPVQPQDMLAAAETLAQQLLGLPEGQKDSELRLLKTKNEVMHSLVVAKLDQIRRQARMAGGQQVLAQQFGMPR